MDGDRELDWFFGGSGVATQRAIPARWVFFVLLKELEEIKGV
jgi:hypothetical protein